MLSISDMPILDDVTKEEWDNPSPRKVEGDRTICTSFDMQMPNKPGDPLILRPWDSQIGERVLEGGVMPDLYREPESSGGYRRVRD